MMSICALPLLSSRGREDVWQRLEPLEVNGSFHFKLLGGAFTGSKLQLVSVDVGNEAANLYGKHAVPLRDHFHFVFFGDDFEHMFELLYENPCSTHIGRTSGANHCDDGSVKVCLQKLLLHKLWTTGGFESTTQVSNILCPQVV